MEWIAAAGATVFAIGVMWLWCEVRNAPVMEDEDETLGLHFGEWRELTVEDEDGNDAIDRLIGHTAAGSAIYVDNGVDVTADQAERR